MFTHSLTLCFGSILLPKKKKEKQQSESWNAFCTALALAKMFVEIF